MRYAVFSDVHANLEAFEAVLEFLRGSNIDRYLFLGDIVGYGADPQECISVLRSLEAVSVRMVAPPSAGLPEMTLRMVAGNHDWACVGKTDIDYFNEAAKRAVLWTKEQIAESDDLFLSGLGLTKEEEGFCLVHGTLSHPEEFDYMMDGYRAAKTFVLLRQKICFVGHSHRPGVFIEDQEKISYQEPQRLSLQEGKRYIVNDGSVGQPRDGDPRAAFCIYDDASGLIEFKRVAYDVVSAQKKIIEAGLPRSLADRLAQGR